MAEDMEGTPLLTSKISMLSVLLRHASVRDTVAPLGWSALIGPDAERRKVLFCGLWSLFTGTFAHESMSDSWYFLY